jgi:hypothetical protein
MLDSQIEHTSRRRHGMSNITLIAERYIAAWNETDSARRRALLTDGWSETASYADPMAAAQGHEQIGALIAGVQERFPNFSFTLDGRVDGYADKLRFSWALGPKSDPEMIKGTDFVLIEGELIKSVTGFLDKLPAAA